MSTKDCALVDKKCIGKLNAAQRAVRGLMGMLPGHTRRKGHNDRKSRIGSNGYVLGENTTHEDQSAKSSNVPFVEMVLSVGER